jgi:hypothetical protein
MAGARFLMPLTLYIMDIIILSNLHTEMCEKAPHAA